jgi:hypothetical protein
VVKTDSDPKIARALRNDLGGKRAAKVGKLLQNESKRGRDA